MATFPPGTIFAKKYRILGQLGAGAMGAVFEAEGPTGVVALKTLLVEPGAAQVAAETRARFDREVAACARLQHRHVLSILDHGIDDVTQAPFFVMPRMRGEDLQALLTRVKRLEPSLAVPIVVQACRGVAAGHAAGIIHRDLKPSNLFLEEEGGTVVVKVSDFGLAKVQDVGIESLTSSGAILGTPHYMSPEQAENAKRVDARTDVYSLGMVLYHALTGGPAFTRSGAFLAYVVGQASVPPVQGAAPWVEPDLARAVHAALLRTPDARWPDAGELELALAMAVGFEAANAPIYRAALAPISEASRRVVAPRAELPAHWQDMLRR